MLRALKRVAPSPLPTGNKADFCELPERALPVLLARGAFPAGPSFSLSVLRLADRTRRISAEGVNAARGGAS